MNRITLLTAIAILVPAHTIKPMEKVVDKRADKTTLLDLPQNAIGEICKNLPLTDIFNVQKVCTRLREAWDNERVLYITGRDLIRFIPKSFGQFSAGKFQAIPHDALNAGIKVFNEKLANRPNPVCLDLSIIPLTKLPDPLKNIRNLTQLNLTTDPSSGPNVSIGSSPDETTNLCNALPHLELLDFSNNHIKELPETIKNLKQLKVLLLSENQLSNNALKNLCQWLPNLKELDLSHNKTLRELPDTLKNLQQLKILRLAGVPITLNDLINICNWLPNLEELDISDNNLTELPETFKNMHHLKILHLNPNNYGTSNKLSLNAITNLCRWLPQLEELSLFLTKQTELPDVFRNMQHLKNLFIWDDGDSDKATITLAHICNWLPNLQGLTFINIYLTKLPTVINNLQHLTTLCLKFNELAQSDLAYLFNSLTNLQALHLGGRKLKELPDALKNLHHLKKLCLDADGLSFNALTNLCNWLSDLEELYLSIDDCSGRDTPIEIPESIKNMRCLRILQLKADRLTSHGFANICWLPNLQELKIQAYYLPEIPSEIQNLVHLQKLALKISEDLMDDKPENIMMLKTWLPNVSFIKIWQVRYGYH